MKLVWHALLGLQQELIYHVKSCNSVALSTLRDLQKIFNKLSMRNQIDTQAKKVAMQKENSFQVIKKKLFPRTPL